MLAEILATIHTLSTPQNPWHAVKRVADAIEHPMALVLKGLTQLEADQAITACELNGETLIALTGHGFNLCKDIDLCPTLNVEKPTVLVGSSMAGWKNIFYDKCPACGSGRLRTHEYCIYCDNWGLDSLCIEKN